ncbi:MAG: CBS domain-containing protein [Acidothermus cellulolyticus]|nr:CBS domain-containing protein [Acidothermus cellulolyticus]
MRLSAVIRQPVVTRSGQHVGRVVDVVIRLRDPGYPKVVGLVVDSGRRRIFVPAGQVAAVQSTRIMLAGDAVDLRPFERRRGELLLRADLLGHRFIDVSHAELVRAFDIELASGPDGWEVRALDTQRLRRWWPWRRGSAAQVRDWKDFEPLLGHIPTTHRRAARRLRRMRAADLADLLEEASASERREILQHVHGDSELEADVFEELEPDVARRLLADKSDIDIADVLVHMRPDDAADALEDLPAERRRGVLDRLPAEYRTKLLALLHFHPTSAGGLMNVDMLTVSEAATAADALAVVAAATTVQPELAGVVHVIDAENRLIGVARVARLLQASPQAEIDTIMDADPVRVNATTDIVDLAILMADYDLTTLPVVDEYGRLLGVVTVDDVLESIIPEEWRRREPPPHPEYRPEPAEDQPA